MNVAKGDLAVLIRSISPENVGATCTVDEFAGPRPAFNGAPGWRVTFSRLVKARNLRTGREHLLRQVIAADSALRRIAGPGLATGVDKRDKLVEPTKLIGAPIKEKVQ